jgi:hypothetical protein
MSKLPGEATGIAGESSPSVGLAVVDSMTGRQIKAFASHAHPALGFRRRAHPAAAPMARLRARPFRHAEGYAGFRCFSGFRNGKCSNGMVQPPFPSLRAKIPAIKNEQ